MSTVKTETPLERAFTIKTREIGTLERSIEGHRKHFDALVLAIDLFGDDPNTVFSLESYAAIVMMTVDDVNATLKHVHRTMKKVDWRKLPFHKKTMTWDWKFEDIEINFLFLLSENATCRKVQVGVEEVPVYEIQCEDNGVTVEIEEPVDS